MRVWRVCLERHATSAFSGEGSLKYAGRWHRAGVRVVYASSSLALAALEYFVRLPALESPNPLVAIPSEIPASVKIIYRAARNLPPGWNAFPPPPTVQRIGMDWIRSRPSPVLGVPSVLIPGEWNFLLNPLHPHFPRIRIGKPVPFALDPRMWKRTR